MSSSTPIITTKDKNHTNDDALSNSCYETLDDQQRNSSFKSSRNDSKSESVIWLFKKYLLTKNQNNMNTKTKVEVDGKTDFRRNNLRRLPSLLEQVLLPQLRSSGEVEATPSKDKTTKQLTIFFDGVINVYNNIPVDKAQEILRLAGESSSLKPVVAERAKTDVRKPSNKSELLSVSKLRAGIPLARRCSLQRFLEKRRDRVISRSPYTLPSEKQEEENEAKIDKGKESNEENRRLLPDLSPFPSRLGYFSLKSSHQG